MAGQVLRLVHGRWVVCVLAGFAVSGLVFRVRCLPRLNAQNQTPYPSILTSDSLHYSLYILSTAFSTAFKLGWTPLAREVGIERVRGDPTG